MLVGFAAFAFGYSLVYWGASHFCGCLHFCWKDKDCCARYSLMCLMGLSKLISGVQTTATEATQPQYLPTAP